MNNFQIMVLRAFTLILDILLKVKKKNQCVDLFNDWKLDLVKVIYANQIGTPEVKIKFGKGVE